MIPRVARHPFLAVLLCMALCGTAAASRPKTDRIEMLNGDVVSGEILRLQQGKLEVDTNKMGTASIDWNYVARITSEFEFEAETKSGRIYLGRLASSAKPRVLTMTGKSGAAEVGYDDIIRIVAIGTEFSDRLDGSFGIAGSSAKASGVSTIDIALDMSYTIPYREFELKAQSTTTQATNTPSSTRQDLSLSGQWLREDRWFTSWYGQYSSNDELGLDHRTLLGGGAGRYLSRQSSQQARMALGLLVGREAQTGTSGSGATDTLEVALFSSYTAFRYDDPELEADAELDLYRDVKDLDRWRGSFHLTLKYELIRDFNLKLSYYYDYDESPAAGASSTDYSTSLGVDWDF
jgi:hypothetical protein